MLASGPPPAWLVQLGGPRAARTDLTALGHITASHVLQAVRPFAFGHLSQASGVWGNNRVT
jgi:hypothetical protein